MDILVQLNFFLFIYCILAPRLVYFFILFFLHFYLKNNMYFLRFFSCFNELNLIIR